VENLKFAIEMATKTSAMEEIYCGTEQECSIDRLEPGINFFDFLLFCTKVM